MKCLNCLGNCGGGGGGEWEQYGCCNNPSYGNATGGPAAVMVQGVTPLTEAFDGFQKWTDLYCADPATPDDAAADASCDAILGTGATVIFDQPGSTPGGVDPIEYSGNDDANGIGACDMGEVSATIFPTCDRFGLDLGYGVTYGLVYKNFYDTNLLQWRTVYQLKVSISLGIVSWWHLFTDYCCPASGLMSFSFTEAVLPPFGQWWPCTPSDGFWQLDTLGCYGANDDNDDQVVDGFTADDFIHNMGDQD